MKLSRDFYEREDVLQIARELLGKRIVTRIDEKMTSGIITETEAYAGVTDRASHAYGGKRTERTKTMYLSGGVSYVYLCYGIHHLFNIVTHKEGIPHAILLRGIEPESGIEVMKERRNRKNTNKGFSSGPGTAAQALGITVQHNGVSLTGRTIWLEETGMTIPEEQIYTGPRIGVDYAGEDAMLPYRFLVTSPLLNR